MNSISQARKCSASLFLGVERAVWVFGAVQSLLFILPSCFTGALGGELEKTTALIPIPSHPIQPQLLSHPLSYSQPPENSLSVEPGASISSRCPKTLEEVTASLRWFLWCCEEARREGFGCRDGSWTLKTSNVCVGAVAMFMAAAQPVRHTLL